jgi:hypothetical protein
MSNQNRSKLALLQRLMTELLRRGNSNGSMAAGAAANLKYMYALAHSC